MMIIHSQCSEYFFLPNDKCMCVSDLNFMKNIFFFFSMSLMIIKHEREKKKLESVKRKVKLIVIYFLHDTFFMMEMNDSYSSTFTLSFSEQFSTLELYLSFYSLFFLLLLIVVYEEITIVTIMLLSHLELNLIIIVIVVSELLLFSRKRIRKKLIIKEKFNNSN